MRWIDELTLAANNMRAKRIEAAMEVAGLELRKIDNRPENLGIRATLALAIALQKADAWR